MKTSTEERFWKYVDKTKPNECWNWLGGKQNGYGSFNAKKLNIQRAHRYSWIIHRGAIPKGMCVCHSCDNPGCVRPAHLFLGTHKENMEDKVKKGRWNGARGEHNTAKTHCPHGHLYSKKNTQILKRKNGKTARNCRACHRIHSINYNRKIKQRKART